MPLCVVLQPRIERIGVGRQVDGTRDRERRVRGSFGQLGPAESDPGLAVARAQEARGTTRLVEPASRGAEPDLADVRNEHRVRRSVGLDARVEVGVHRLRIGVLAGLQGVVLLSPGDFGCAVQDRGCGGICLA